MSTGNHHKSGRACGLFVVVVVVVFLELSMQKAESVT